MELSKSVFETSRADRIVFPHYISCRGVAQVLKGGKDKGDITTHYLHIHIFFFFFFIKQMPISISTEIYIVNIF